MGFLMKTTLVLLMLPAVLAGCALDSQPDESPAARAAHEWEAYTQRPRGKPPVKRSGNVTIIVDKIVGTEADSLDLDLLWRYVNESAAAGTQGGVLARRNGIRIGAAADGFSAALDAAMRKSKGSQSEKLWLTVLSGTQGSILVGQDVFVSILRCRTLLGESVLLKNAFVGASMVIEPRLLPNDDIQVKLHPRFSTREGATVDLTDLTTELVLHHGQPMVMAGLDQASDSAGFALFSYGKTQRQSRMTLVVTPFIEGAPED